MKANKITEHEISAKWRIQKTTNDTRLNLRETNVDNGVSAALQSVQNLAALLFVNNALGAHTRHRGTNPHHHIGVILASHRRVSERRQKDWEKR